MSVDLAISPCPNDTFIFHHFIRTGISDHKIVLHLDDVEELNRRAIEEQRHILTKLSYFAIARLQDSYTLLRSGGALGRGCGPILISSLSDDRNPHQKFLEDLDSGNPLRILIPGKWTTANLLLHLYLDDGPAKSTGLNRIEFLPVRYDRIMSDLRSGKEKYGVIIHEERFTYPRYGLGTIQDMGEWWEKSTGNPIPLGGIAVRNDMLHLKEEAEHRISESILHARKFPDDARDFIKSNAQALEDDVIRSHIDLYVNDFSVDMGDEGARAVEELFRRAKGFMV